VTDRVSQNGLQEPVIEIRCPNWRCNELLYFSDDQVGQTGKCPRCGLSFLVAPSAYTPDKAENGNSRHATESISEGQEGKGAPFVQQKRADACLQACIDSDGVAEFYARHLRLLDQVKDWQQKLANLVQTIS